VRRLSPFVELLATTGDTGLTFQDLLHALAPTSTRISPTQNGTVTNMNVTVGSIGSPATIEGTSRTARTNNATPKKNQTLGDVGRDGAGLKRDRSSPLALATSRRVPWSDFCLCQPRLKFVLLDQQRLALGTLRVPGEFRGIQPAVEFGTTAVKVRQRRLQPSVAESVDELDERFSSCPVGRELPSVR